MNTKIFTLFSGLVLASVLGVASAAPISAAPTTAKAQDVFAALDATKISLEDAIKTAENSVAGKPTKAILDEKSIPAAYRVAITDSAKRTVTVVKIDSVTGKILDSRVYHPDNQAKAGAAVGIMPPAAKAKASTTTMPTTSTPLPAAKPATQAKPVTQGTATTPATPAPAVTSTPTTAPATTK